MIKINFIHVSCTRKTEETTMATITQTIEETLTFTAKPPQKQKKVRIAPQESTKLLGPKCPPDCKECLAPPTCPPDCEECKKIAKNCPGCNICKQNSKMPIFFNTLGILIAVLATYLMVTTDSNLYLVFWVCYSVLRKMMTKSKSGKSKECKTE